MGSFRPSLADSISVQENFVSFSALWASAHPRFSFPAGFWQFRLRLRKSLGSFCLLPEISASQPGNSVPFPPGFGNSYLNVKFFFPFLPIFSPLSFRTSTFVLFPVFHKKNSSFSARVQHFGLCRTEIWGILVNFQQFWLHPSSPSPSRRLHEQFHPPLPKAGMQRWN